MNVEEYKRPKFQVTLDAPKTAARLGGEVQLEGKAMAYTGAAVGGAKIRYRVVRQVRYPDWWYWCFCLADARNRARRRSPTARPRPQADGSFKIQFIAKPDLSVAEKDEPVFQYEVSADVTDTNGETRSAERHGPGRLHGPAGLAQPQAIGSRPASRSRSSSPRPRSTASRKRPKGR